MFCTKFHLRLLLLAEGFCPMLTKLELNWFNHLRNLGYDLPDIFDKIVEVR